MPRRLRLAGLSVGGTMIVLLAAFFLYQAFYQGDTRLQPTGKSVTSAPKHDKSKNSSDENDRPNALGRFKSPRDLWLHIDDATAEELAAILSSKDLVAKLAPELQNAIFLRLMTLDGATAITLTRQGLIAPELWEKKRFSADFFRENPEVCKNELLEGTLTTEGDRAMFDCLYQSAVVHAPELAIETYFSRPTEELTAGMKLGCNVAFQALTRTDPKTAVDVALKFATDEQQRKESLLAIGETIAVTRPAEAQKIVDDLVPDRTSPIHTGYISWMLRTDPELGVKALQNMPVEMLPEIFKSQISVYNLAKYDPDVALSTLSAIPSSEANFQTVEMAAFLISKANHDNLVDWISKENDPEKLIPIVKGLIRSVSKSNPAEANQWEEYLQDIPSNP